MSSLLLLLLLPEGWIQLTKNERNEVCVRDQNFFPQKENTGNKIQKLIMHNKHNKT